MLNYICHFVYVDTGHQSSRLRGPLSPFPRLSLARGLERGDDIKNSLFLAVTRKRDMTPRRGEAEDVMMKNTKRNTDQVAAPFNLSRYRVTTGSRVVTERENRRERTEMDERNAFKTSHKTTLRKINERKALKR